jgi:hypothetical protein
MKSNLVSDCVAPPRGCKRASQVATASASDVVIEDINAFSDEELFGAHIEAVVLEHETAVEAQIGPHMGPGASGAVDVLEIGVNFLDGFDVLNNDGLSSTYAMSRVLWTQHEWSSELEVRYLVWADKVAWLDWSNEIET